MENETQRVIELTVQAPSQQIEKAALPLRLAFSIRETALILGISEKSVRRLISRRLLRASTALRHIMVAKKEIERFLTETSS